MLDARRTQHVDQPADGSRERGMGDGKLPLGIFQRLGKRMRFRFTLVRIGILAVERRANVVEHRAKLPDQLRIDFLGRLQLAAFRKVCLSRRPCGGGLLEKSPVSSTAVF